MITSCYYILDRDTGNRWARNRWATPSTIPDLYRTYNGAKAQVENGKVGLLVDRYAMNVRIAKAELTT